MFKRISLATAAAVALMAAAASAQAAIVDWTQWNGQTDTGVSGAIGVTYSGDTFGTIFDYPSWLPSSTYAGGTVSNAPAPANGMIQTTGGDNNVNTITFSSAVLNPVMAIWSLGQGGDPTRFLFTNNNISLEAGGPSLEYSGQSITLGGQTVTGVEGNGTIQFNGLVTSISWTNPDYEFWYGFTVGTPGVAGAPEPAAWA